MLTMLDRVQYYLLFFICSTLIICTTPQVLRLSISGGLSSKLSWYFIFIGIVVTILFRHKYVFEQRQEITLPLKYICAYLFFSLMSLLIGLYNFPFYDAVFNAPVAQFDRAHLLHDFLKEYGINIESNHFFLIWMVFRLIRNLLLETIYTFGASYCIYIWFRNKEDLCIRALLRGILAAVVVILVYTVVEIPYVFYNNEYCKAILTFLNPILHDIKDGGTWWPPLLWPDIRIRSVFAEPSYLGIYMAFAMPWLWYMMISKKHYRANLFMAVIILLNTFLVFLTKSRTGIVILIGELLLLSLVAVYFFKIKDFKSLFRNIAIICLSFAAFIGANFLIEHSSFDRTNESQKSNIEIQKQVESYVSENVSSLRSSDKRSNRARFSIMIANLNIGVKHPILGVGPSLRQAYVIHYLPTEAFEDNEVRGWIQNQKAKGVFKGSFPSLGEYTTRFAETGLFGILLFLLPPISLIFKILKIILTQNPVSENDYVLLYYLISLLGILATGIGESLNVTYCYWILLGIGFVLTINRERKLCVNKGKL